MSVTVFCESCGESIAVDANLCERCGTTLAVAGPAGDADGSRQCSVRRSGFDSRPAAERLESLTPGATELGALVQFRQIGDGGCAESYPVPVDTSNFKTNRTGEYRLFGFSEAVPAYASIPLLIWLIDALIAKDFFGRANADSVFGVFVIGGLVVGVIGGLVVGAIGGLLVTQAPKRQAAGVSSLQGLGR